VNLHMCHMCYGIAVRRLPYMHQYFSSRHGHHAGEHLLTSSGDHGTSTRCPHLATWQTRQTASCFVYVIISPGISTDGGDEMHKHITWAKCSAPNVTAGASAEAAGFCDVHHSRRPATAAHRVIEVVIIHFVVPADKHAAACAAVVERFVCRDPEAGKC
jgi:hypothetical protein